MQPLEIREPATVQPVFPHRTSGYVFCRMVAISLLLHAFFSYILLTSRHETLKRGSVSYLELKDFAVKNQTPPLHPLPVEEEVRPAEPGKTEAPVPEGATETETLRRDVAKLMADSSANPEQLHDRSFGLGLMNGYFSSIAEGESLREEIKDYYFTMLREINEKWWVVSNGNRERGRDAVVEIVVARDGMIVGKSLIRSSGNPAFDRTIFVALEKANPLPPLPQNYRMKYFVAPIRFIAPFGLFAS